MTSDRRPLGLVLAGGLARRMGGGDKILLTIGRRKILDRVLDRLRPQCASLIINANGDPARFAATKLPVVPDSVPGFVGPLAGILASLDWAAANAPGASDIVFFHSPPLNFFKLTGACCQPVKSPATCTV